jgi:hypothetical protein
MTLARGIDSTIPGGKLDCFLQQIFHDLHELVQIALDLRHARAVRDLDHQCIPFRQSSVRVS